MREQKRGSLSLFLSFLASFAIKEAARGGGGIWWERNSRGE